MSNRSQGYADVLVGLQYGDEGKAKIVDLIAPEYDIVARFNGGANAGHTVQTPTGTVVLQQVPSAVFRPKTSLYIGSGCAVNLWKLRAELEMLESLGVDLDGRLAISDRCALIQPSHLILDELNGDEIGTTKNGIGPCYADRASRFAHGQRVNLQIRDVLANADDSCAWMRSGAQVALEQIDRLDVRTLADVEERLASLADCIESVRPFVQGDPFYLQRRVLNGERVLFEGAQSVMLDVVHGDQPFVTASHTVPAYAYVGGDLPPRHHRYTIGVAKALTSRVGNGPFPSELGGERAAAYFTEACRNGRGAAQERAEYDGRKLLSSSDPMELGIALRMLTQEYGTGTGRPRRIGMLDLVQLREVVSNFGVDLVYLNKVDCLELYEESLYSGIPVRVPREGAPRDAPEIIVLPPFAVDPGCASTALLEFKDFVEQHIGVPLIGMGLGPERGHIAEFFALNDHVPSVDAPTISPNA